MNDEKEILEMDEEKTCPCGSGEKAKDCCEKEEGCKCEGETCNCEKKAE